MDTGGRVRSVDVRIKRCARGGREKVNQQSEATNSGIISVTRGINRLEMNKKEKKAFLLWLLPEFVTFTTPQIETCPDDDDEERISVFYHLLDWPWMISQTDGQEQRKGC